MEPDPGEFGRGRRPVAPVSSPATDFTYLLLILIGSLSLWLAVLAGLKQSWIATVVAIGSLAFLPVWLGASLGPFFVSAHLVTLGLAVAAILVSRGVNVEPHAADLTLFGLLLVDVGMVLAGVSTLSQAYTLIQWMLAYCFGRLAAASFGARRVYTATGIVFALAAVGLILESASGVNPWTEYLHLDNSLYTAWGPIQTRGETVRVEGAFGHSIAAGCSLALAAVLTLDSKLRPWLRMVCLIAMSVAVLLTISRLGTITIAVGISLAVVLGRSSLTRAAKAAAIAILAAGAAIYAVALSEVFALSASEASDSASYRLWLVELLPSLQPFGYASSATRSTAGEIAFGQYASVDNAVLYYALTNGWVPTLVLLVLLGAAAVKVARRRAGVATVAVVAAIPALFGVALITQYALVFWMVVGLAVSETPRSDSPLRQELLPETAPADRQPQPTA